MEPRRRPLRTTSDQRRPPSRRRRTRRADIRDWTIYVVDSHSLIFQVFHAIGSELTSPRGEPVGAVYGFTRDLLQLIEQKQPTALVCAFDLSGPTFRHELYDAYKADRGEMPEALVGADAQDSRKCSRRWRFPILECPGFEADDVLATVARMCDEAGANCCIVTGDKDCRQLITDRVAVYNIRKDEEYDATALDGDWGIAPEQVVDFQALVGDKVDNVPGVPLIGPKLAKELLEKYGTLENVLDHADEVPGAKRQQNLIDYREAALLSRKLVELDTQRADRDRLARRPRRRLRPRARSPSCSATSASARSADRAMAVAERRRRRQDRPARRRRASRLGRRLPDRRHARGARRARRASSPSKTQISIDTETTHISPRCAEIVGYSFAWKPGQAFYVPVRGPAGERVLDPAATADALRPILENPAIAKIGQNLKYDMIVLRSVGHRARAASRSTRWSPTTCSTPASGPTTSTTSPSKYLDHETIKIDELIGTGKNQKRMDQVPVAQVGALRRRRRRRAAAAAADARSSGSSADGLDELNDNVEMPLIDVLADLEYLGVRVDVGAARRAERRVRRAAAAAQGRNRRARRPPAQHRLAQAARRAAVQRAETAGPQEDQDRPEHRRRACWRSSPPLHPLPAKIVEYRQYSKLLGTYIDALPELVHPATRPRPRVAQPGRRRHGPAQLQQPEPAKHPHPHRAKAAKSARRSTPASPAGCCSPPTTRRSSCAILAHYSGDADAARRLRQRRRHPPASSPAR